MLDLTPLNSAIAQLENALADAARYPEVETVRAGVIQCFEFTYDLCPKMLRRFFAETEAAQPEGDDGSFPNLIRLASVRGLVLNGWDRWFTYRKSRNITSHTYDRAKALEVLSIVPAFLEDARYLRDRMARRLKDA